MTKYLGLTIGPIIKTLQSARSTGELWGSSYIFSYIIKQIIMKFKDERDFIVPYAKDEELFSSKSGIGVFPDKIIFKSKENDFKRLGEAVEEILTKLAMDIADAIEAADDKRADIISFVKQYFQIYFLELDLYDNDNPILEVSRYLDILELQRKTIAEERDNPLLSFLKNDVIKASFLMKDAVNSLSKDISFPTTQDIASDKADMRRFYNIELTENEKEQEEGPADYGYSTEFKTKNYIAIVQADGDNVGEVIANLKGEAEFHTYSKDLSDFAREAHRRITGYNGMTIYAGGDDMLFFAPVLLKDKSIFDLLDEISEEFDSRFSRYEGSNGLSPSISFGVSISYYKYPLYEALEKARELLNDNAKGFKFNDKNKNAIAYRVLKNSGQFFGTTFSKEFKSYKTFKRLLRFAFEQNEFLRALQYKLKNDEAILKHIAHEKQRINNYLKNNFNETVHKSSSIENYLELVSQLIYEVYQEDDTSKKEKMIDSIYSYIEFVNFAFGKEKQYD